MVARSRGPRPRRTDCHRAPREQRPQNRRSARTRIAGAPEHRRRQQVSATAGTGRQCLGHRRERDHAQYRHDRYELYRVQPRRQRRMGDRLLGTLPARSRSRRRRVAGLHCKLRRSARAVDRAGCGRLCAASCDGRATAPGQGELCHPGAQLRNCRGPVSQRLELGTRRAAGEDAAAGHGRGNPGPRSKFAAAQERARRIARPHAGQC